MPTTKGIINLSPKIDEKNKYVSKTRYDRSNWMKRKVNDNHDQPTQKAQATFYFKDPKTSEQAQTLT